MVNFLRGYENIFRFLEKTKYILYYWHILIQNGYYLLTIYSRILFAYKLICRMTKKKKSKLQQKFRNCCKILWLVETFYNKTQTRRHESFRNGIIFSSSITKSFAKHINSRYVICAIARYSRKSTCAGYKQENQYLKSNFQRPLS